MKEIPKEIEEVRVRFENWRQTRSKKGPIPEELWQAAIHLTQKYPTMEMARYLRLNHNVLKSKAQKASTPPVSVEIKTPSPEPADFVQLPSVPLFTVPEKAECTVEWVDSDGATLSLRLPHEHPVDVVGLFDAFWRRKFCSR